MVLCPECERDIDEGEIISCAECGSNFEVITVNPLELRPLSDEDEEEQEEEDEGY
jgi:alpha-aminoadipate carrier protein LysW